MNFASSGERNTSFLPKSLDLQLRVHFHVDAAPNDLIQRISRDNPTVPAHQHSRFIRENLNQSLAASRIGTSMFVWPIDWRMSNKGTPAPMYPVI